LQSLQQSLQQQYAFEAQQELNRRAAEHQQAMTNLQAQRNANIAARNGQISNLQANVYEKQQELGQRNKYIRNLESSSATYLKEASDKTEELSKHKQESAQKQEEALLAMNAEYRQQLNTQKTQIETLTQKLNNTIKQMAEQQMAPRAAAKRRRSRHRDGRQQEATAPPPLPPVTTQSGRTVTRTQRAVESNQQRKKRQKTNSPGSRVAGATV
jgi:chromosome segregation ATPase